MWTSKYVYTCTYPCYFEQVPMYFDFVRIHSGPVTNKETHNCKKIWLYRYRRDWIPVLLNLDDQIPTQIWRGEMFFLLQCLGTKPEASSLSTQHTTLKHPKSSFPHHSQKKSWTFPHFRSEMPKSGGQTKVRDFQQPLRRATGCFFGELLPSGFLFAWTLRFSFFFEQTQLMMFKKEFKYWFLLENPP